MASINNYNFPQFPSPPPAHVTPPPPAHPIRPPPPSVTPPSPARPIRPPPPPVTPPSPIQPISPPPPPPHVIPTPTPPHRTPPPKPHPITPPPPHILPPPPPSPPDHHSTVIIIVFVSFGCLLFLACSLLALWCFIKKRKKKTVQETEIIDIDEHLKVKEAVVQGPHGPKRVVLSVEDDVHIHEVDMKNSKSTLTDDHQNMHAKSGEITPSNLEEGTSSSNSSHNQHSKQNP